MATSPRPYTRLTRAALSAGTYSSLWLGRDHLMIVKSNGYSQDYARVELRDIKGFFTTETERRGWWLTVWSIFGVIELMLVISNLISDEVPWISGSLLVVAVGLVQWNHALGAGCRVYVVTGVQTAVLHSLVRRRKAQSVLGRLRPLIEAAQADLVTAPQAGPAQPPTIVP
jgi:hypothetical protein